ncbi:transcription antitermination factor NusB [Leptolyngbya sp. 'hensonii']|uniref:transcription antitermination factor NusB n=1 Tax=Leptolyngbya sp. 'hensonii' TaxID=1922337 RepID=UPI00094F9A99|nr:transcription antitermination factor NusB [Leptolyngbya sp. 'hensonii']OLP17127.1 transcription antitermination factor NusB [Leptolyngbya sp. 'hensonii']
MQSRQIARELALLGISQLRANQGFQGAQQLSGLLLAAIRALRTEVHDVLEGAASEVSRARDRLIDSDVRAADVQAAKTLLETAIASTQGAINRMGSAIELPELIHLANQEEVRAYALRLISAFHSHQAKIDEMLTQSLVDWQLDRLARIDRDILRIAVTEIMFIDDVPEQVAINEAVELAKRYSSDDGYRFINGVLRRVSNLIKAESV